MGPSNGHFELTTGFNGNGEGLHTKFHHSGVHTRAQDVFFDRYVNNLYRAVSDKADGQCSLPQLKDWHIIAVLMSLA